MYRHTGGQLVDLQAQPTNQMLIGRYRRNRKLQSCEPCRKSKLACDHNVPCGRCIKRRRVDQCFFHPNPLTRNPTATAAARTGTSGILTPSPSSITPEDRPEISLSIEPHQEGTSKNPAGSQRTAGRVDPKLHRASSAPPLDSRTEHTPGKSVFLGITSYSAFMTDGLDKLGVASADLHDVPFQHITISNDKIARGCRALSFLQDKALVDRLITLLFESPEGMGAVPGEIISRRWVEELWRFHGDTLQSQKPEAIRQLCQSLFRNTQRPLEFDVSTTSSQWASSATGINIRWEVIGWIAVGMAVFAYFASPTNDILREFNKERSAFLAQTCDVVDMCLDFCRGVGATDDLFLFLLMAANDVMDLTQGDSSYESYRLSAELSSAVVAMGYHQDVEAGGKVPFFLAQMRKSLRSLSYTREISMSSFLGRPPRISYRYWNVTDSALDLTDSELNLESPEELAAVVASLDETGINKKGEMRHTTFIRSYQVMAVNREKIMDLALGHWSREEMLRRADEILQSIHEHSVKLPDFVIKGSVEEPDIDPTRPIESMLRTSFYQASLANKLVLQRVLVRKAGISSKGLVQVAQKMLSNVIRTSERTDLGPTTTESVNHMLAFHGLRSAATLAIELLKQEQLPAYPEEPLLPRSQTIRDLSVYVSRLNGIRVTAGATSICVQGRKVISRILDKILSPPNAANRPCGCSHGLPQQPDMNAPLDRVADSAVVPDGLPTADEFNFGVDAPLFGHDYDFQQWLENMDWEQSA